MIYDILFAVVGIGLIAMGLSLFKLSDRVDCWVTEVMRLMKDITDIDNHRLDDNAQLGEAFKRIQALEERLYALEETSGTYFKSQL